MAGTLFLKPRFRRGFLPDDDALFLTREDGLIHFENVAGPRLAVDPAQWGIDRALVARIAEWSGTYCRLADGLPQRKAPEHCREFDIQRHNRHGLALARAILDRLPEGHHLVFRPLKRQAARHRSRLIEEQAIFRRTGLRIERDGPRPAHYEDSRDPERWVRVMADWGSSGLWHRSGCMMGADNLPVGDALKQRLRHWVARYFNSGESWCAGKADVFARYATDDRELRAYSDEGLALARAIKRALPDWTVVYFDEDLSGRHAIRSRFEFEIKATGSQVGGIR